MTLHSPAAPTTHTDAPPGAPPDPEQIYAERVVRFGTERAGLSRRMDRVANLRLGAFALVALFLGLAVWRREPLLGLPAFLALAGFAALVRRHNRLDAAWRRAGELERINREAGARLRRAWDELPLRAAISAPDDHPYAGDLDVFGRASLYHLLDPGMTRAGERTLAAWLSTPAEPREIRERQEGVEELAPRLDMRHELALRARLLGAPSPDPEPFLAWVEGAPWLARRRWLVWVARGSVALLWLAILGGVLNLVPGRLWIVFFVFNVALTYATVWRVSRTGSVVRLGGAALRAYSDLFGLLSCQPFRAPVLEWLRAELGTGEDAADARLRRLSRLADLLIPPGSALYLPVQGLTLWDIHALDRIERWQAAHGGRARGWLGALGEAEALAALAGLAHDNPRWAFPVVDPAAAELRAAALGHPLIRPEARVDNDVAVGPRGTFMLVTGSNMSGKSTLLRAIGANLVLAGAGGPVCAAGFSTPPVHLWTSMRIEDSLAEGTSYFMAELTRLKAVVDAARPETLPAGRPLFYLLDEILQGTNTRERQIAARRIVAHLVRTGALGAVSTHDLALADEESLASMARPIHFTETISDGPGGPRMAFDYTVRPGIATSTNALRLMEIVGLDVGGAGPADGKADSAVRDH